MRRIAAALSALSALLVMSLAGAARAELEDDAARLVRGYVAEGARVRRVATVFLNPRETRHLAIMRSPSSKEPCTSIVALGVRELAFRAELLTASLARGSGAAVKAVPLGSESRAGFVVLARCGDGPSPAPLAAEIVVTMAGTRGALELFVVEHAHGTKRLDELLPERAVGPTAAAHDVGGPLAAAAFPGRLSRVRASAQRDGAVAVVAVETRASAVGSGALRLKLTAGCHRLHLLADASAAPELRFDVDAEVRLLGTSESLRVDRAILPDARLDFCLGESGAVDLGYVGSGGPLPLTIVDALWPLPRGLPERWPSALRSEVAWAMFRRRAPQVIEPPVLEVLGGHGATRVPLELERGACYLAALGLDRPGSSARLMVRLGERQQHDDASLEERGAAVAFCSGGEERARAEIELRGAGGTFRLALWRLGT